MRAATSLGMCLPKCKRILNVNIKAIREEDLTSGKPHGHITSVAVMRTYRRLGLAEKLMKQSRNAFFSHSFQVIRKGHAASL